MNDNGVDKIPKNIRQDYDCTFEVAGEKPCMDGAIWWIDGDSYCNRHKQIIVDSPIITIEGEGSNGY